MMQTLFNDKYVVKPNESDGDRVPYLLVGPRAQWGMVRSQSNPTMLFLVSAAGCCDARVRGYNWFHEVEPGRVEPIS